METAYYKYLCRLLNPTDGHEAARQDSELLKEFCEMSIGTGSGGKNFETRIENFLNIASPSSQFHTSYRRDLMMLLELSSSIENHNLSLDLGKYDFFTPVSEILERIVPSHIFFFSCWNY